MRGEETGDKNGELFETKSASSVIATNGRYRKNDTDLREEYRALGFFFFFHPLALWKDDVLAVKYRTKALRIGDYAGRNVKMIGWPVTQKDVWTKDGLAMCFLSLEDETALYETVVFPDVYTQYSTLLFDQRPLLLYGRVTNDQGAVSLEVSRIERLGEALSEKHAIGRRGQYQEPACAEESIINFLSNEEPVACHGVLHYRHLLSDSTINAFMSRP
jgi:DNA polymerase III alpha subunit